VIFVSSSCVKNDYIWQSVQQIAENGFNKIELSGGTKRDNGSVKKLLELKEKYNLTYRCHNYFPPPAVDFVMNLASDSSEIYKNTVDIIKESIGLSKTFESDKYGFHAGFLTDIGTSEIGKAVKGRALFDKNEALRRFKNRAEAISENNDSDLKIYIENNVVSKNNFENFGGKNCFLMTSYADVNELKKQFNFNLLLDVAHLYVSSNTLGKNFFEEFSALNTLSDYLHISDNNGLSDQNKKLSQGSEIYTALSLADLSNKTFTLEINNDMGGLIESYSLLEELVSKAAVIKKTPGLN
jgi:sugar phosphate isomerase/epimerase